MAKIGVLNLRDNVEKLKPCPFCGGGAILAENKKQYKIFCTECDAQYGWREDRDDVIQGWNRREGDANDT